MVVRATIEYIAKSLSVLYPDHVISTLVVDDNTRAIISAHDTVIVTFKLREHMMCIDGVYSTIDPARIIEHANLTILNFCAVDTA